MAARKADTDEACPTCGQRPRPKEKPKSDFDRGMDFWAAKSAYQAQGALEILAIVALLGGMMLITSGVGSFFGY